MDRPQFILFIEPARAEMPEAPTEQEIRFVGEHFNYLKGQLEAGNVVLVGRTQEPPFTGIAIFEAEDIEAARRFAENDPAIGAGVFKLIRVQPYKVALMRT
ncbi:MAG: YciI family protein [Fimbriimonadales bacterium]